MQSCWGNFSRRAGNQSVSVNFMKIYPGIERGLRKQHPAIDFLTPSTHSLFPPVTILFYFPRARKKKAKERDGIEGEAASSSGGK